MAAPLRICSLPLASGSLSAAFFIRMNSNHLPSNLYLYLVLTHHVFHSVTTNASDSNYLSLSNVRNLRIPCHPPDTLQIPLSIPITVVIDRHERGLKRHFMKKTNLSQTLKISQSLAIKEPGGFTLQA